MSMMKIRNTVCLSTLAFIALGYYSAAFGQARIDESKIQDTIFVSTTGDDSNNGLTRLTAKASVWGASKAASASFFTAAKPVCVFILNGMYKSSTKQPEFVMGSDYGLTPLAIVGESKGGVCLNGNGNNYGIKIIRNNVVLRNLEIFNAKSAIGGHEFTPREPVLRNWIIEDCTFRDCPNSVTIWHVDSLTARRCTVQDMQRRGIHFITRFALIEDFEVYNCGISTDTLVNNSARHGLFLTGTDVIIRRLNAHHNGYIGLRMDHVAERVVVTDSRIVNNASSGTMWETAIGPVSFERCLFANNGKYGAFLATAHDISFRNCRFQDNKRGALCVSNKPRSTNVPSIDSYMAGDLDSNHWVGKKPLDWVLNTTVKRCTLTTTLDSSYVYIKALNEGQGQKYVDWFTTEMHSDSNVFFSTKKVAVFDLGQNITSYKLNEFGQWQTATGEDAHSEWKGVGRVSTIVPFGVQLPRINMRAPLYMLNGRSFTGTEDHKKNVARGLRLQRDKGKSWIKNLYLAR